MIMAASQLMQNSKYDRTASIHGLCGDVVVGSWLPGSSCHRCHLRAVAVPVGPSRCRMHAEPRLPFSANRAHRAFTETASSGTVRWPVRDAGRALASFSPRSPATLG